MKSHQTFIAGRNVTARDESVAVVEPDRPTEFEIQAVIWRGLRDLGINSRGEVCSVFAGRAKVRFDIAVFGPDGLAGIIEVKVSSICHATDWHGTRQGSRYGQFRVPVRIVYGMSEAEALLEDAKRGDLWP